MAGFCIQSLQQNSKTSFMFFFLETPPMLMTMILVVSTVTQKPRFVRKTLSATSLYSHSRVMALANGPTPFLKKPSALSHLLSNHQLRAVTK